MSQPPNDGPPNEGPPNHGPPNHGPPNDGRAAHGQAPYGQAPYGQAPYGQAPYGQGQPPGGWGPPVAGPPYPSPYTPLDARAPDRGMRWVGLGVGFVLGPVVLITLVTVINAVVSAAGSDSGLANVAMTLVLGAFGLALVAGLVFRQTRWWALGMIIGIAVTFIVLAGACIALIFFLTSAMET